MDPLKLQEIRKIILDIQDQNDSSKLNDDEFTARMYSESNSIPLWKAREELNALVAADKVIFVRTLSGTRVYTYPTEVRSIEKNV